MAFNDGIYKITLIDGAEYFIALDSGDKSLKIIKPTGGKTTFVLTGSVENKIRKLLSPNFYRQYIKSIWLVNPKEGW